MVAVVVATIVCGAMWALSSPVGSSPDDQYHQATIWCVGATSTTDPETCRVSGQTAEGGRIVEVPALVAASSCYAFKPAESAACQHPLREGIITTEAIDNGSYPGGFYRVMHLLKTDSVPESILAMRLLNVVIAAVLLGGIALLGSAALRRLMVLTLVPVLLPLGWFILASVNPSSWALSGLTAYGFALHSFLLLTDRRRQIATGALGVVALVLALSARGDAPAYAGVITVALCVLHYRRLWAAKRLLLIPVVVGAVCLWRVLAAAQVATIAGASAESERTLAEVVPALMLEFPTLLSGMFGYGFGLGWLDTTVPAVTAFPVVLVIGFLGLTGLGRLSVSKALAVLIIAGPMLLLPLMTLFRTRLIVGESVQPRYLLPLMPILLAVLLTDRVVDDAIRLSRVQAVAIAVSMTVACTAAIYANVRRYITGVDGPTLIDKTEWWWQSAPAPTTVVIVGGLSFAVFAASLVWTNWRSAPTSEPDGVMGAADAAAPAPAGAAAGTAPTQESE